MDKFLPWDEKSTMLTFVAVKRLILIFASLLPFTGIQAQIGGGNTYEFLILTPSARLSALGGINISTMDDDVHLGSQNPALVNPEMHRRLGLSYTPWLAGIQYGYAGYSQTFEGIGSFHSGIQYMNTGQMQGADEFGNPTGTFAAQELVWMLGGSRAWKGFRYGTNLKVISSTLAPGFSSWGMALDLGSAYRSQDSLFSAGLMVRNLGMQFSTYTPTGARESLPFEVVAGVSNRLRYMPMRFSVTLIHLEHPNLLFDDPNTEPEVDLNGNVIEPGPRIADRIFRHFVFSTEFYLGNFLRLRAGYNHLRRQELRSKARGGITGFSFGAGIRASRFAFDYGFSSYGVRSSFNVSNFSLSIDLNRREAKDPAEETK